MNPAYKLVLSAGWSLDEDAQRRLAADLEELVDSFEARERFDLAAKLQTPRDVELRNHLAIIDAAAQRLARHPRDADEVKELAKVIRRAVARTLNL